ncbi:MAG: TRAP transporter large permease subunit [Paracoccaceae bacterium]
MFLGLDGVEISLIIVFVMLFAGIMTGFPVAFAISGAAIISFGILAGLDNAGLLIKEVIDKNSDAFRALTDSGVARETISHFRYPDLPLLTQPLFTSGWEKAMDSNLSFMVNRMNERVISGPSIETLLAVLMFVMMGITLERSRIANDLLTTMARVFGPLPGGLAVSVVVVGAFLAASTGIVGATVVTMGLLSLPTMLRNNYSPELATGVIAAAGTLGQIIPPSIVIVLLGTLAGDIYSTAQENLAKSVGCGSALTFLGEAAVLSVGTLFKAAILPGIMLAVFYALYAFGYAMLRPHKAPPIRGEVRGAPGNGLQHGLTWFLVAPAAIIGLVIGLGALNVVGPQHSEVSSLRDIGAQPELRTDVPEQCAVAMIERHGQAKWDRSVALAAEIAAAGGLENQEARTLSADEMDAARAQALLDAAPIGNGIIVMLVLAAITFTTAFGIAPFEERRPLFIGVVGIGLAIMADILFLDPLTSPLATFLWLTPGFALILYALKPAFIRLGRNEMLRVVFPPLVLIVAVLGSILGGITNPTPAAALGASGAIMLAAYRKLGEVGGQPKLILYTAFAIVIMLLVGINFDLRTNIEGAGLQNWLGLIVTYAAYMVAMGGLLYSCFVLWKHAVLTPVVRETAKVTSMVFAILIGSQLLNLVVISFGGEEYIQDFLRSFDEQWVVFLLVMVVLFVLGFVLDFLEIVYIVIPIVGPVIYGGNLDPSWVTIMIAVNLQTSFLTPPFGFALFYLRGVAPAGVTTGHIYRGVLPFVLIQVAALAVLWMFPSIVTIVPDLLPGN